MKQLTAVEILENSIKDLIPNDIGSQIKFKNKIILAKKMEKQQIENAFEKGFITTQWDKTKENKAEQSYKETFKNTKQ
jgi:hypothetical protein